MPHDDTRVSDNLSVVVGRGPSMAYVCSKCGKASKPDHDPNWVVCSNRQCLTNGKRTKWQPKDGDVELQPATVGYANPCPKCGKGGKPDHTPGTFICSMKDCRYTW